MKRIGIFLCLLSSLSLLLFVPEKNYQQEISEKILRFHVIANSNSLEDQQLKLEVRNDIVGYLADKLKDCATLEESRTVVSRELSNIETVASSRIEAQGYDYTVHVALKNRYFPVKTYGEMTFPRGWYDALTVDIGKAAGRNWWCVIFPNLCFTDAVSAYVPSDSEQLLEQELTKDTYASLYEGENVQIRFKLGEILDDLFSE